MARRAIVLKASGRALRQRRGLLHNIPNVDDDTDRFYVIEKLIDRRYNRKKRRTEYLVRWKNYPPSDDTWEPEEEININAAEMVREYNNGQKKDSTDNTLHCICRKSYRFEDGGMVQCANCFVWYHFSCIKMNMEDANSFLKFFCSECKKVNPHLKSRLKPEKVKLFYNRSLSDFDC